ncbi:MAG: hypothetical protein NC177_14855 [Ruminococcus flavefaciens]|nr:hypothetical protein [Ruminococcus flavefaciens]
MSKKIIYSSCEDKKNPLGSLLAALNETLSDFILNDEDAPESIKLGVRIIDTRSRIEKKLIIKSTVLIDPDISFDDGVLEKRKELLALLEKFESDLDNFDPATTDDSQKKETDKKVQN